ncbi:MAG: DUF2281 domain-containing protein [Leptolyngbyaceae cyanobacterium CSU_1_3]|nr:DUF2281 domain-containing protein [Leptolyngbyaceae cyanobacterium CSU_1_3]
MKSVQKMLTNEINKTPENLLQEALDFVMFINYKHSQTQTKTSTGWQSGFFEEVIGG